MEADSGIVVVYAPWKLFDLVAQQEQGTFYDVPHDLLIERNDHAELLDHVLRHHIFPEIHIARRDALQRLMPRINEHAFFAFVHAADYLSLGAVLIQSAVLRLDHPLLRRRRRAAAGNERGRARLGPLPRRARVHPRPRRQPDRAPRSARAFTCASRR